MEHRDAVKLNENVKKASDALVAIGKELAKMQHPSYASVEPINTSEPFARDIPVELDWETPHIEGVASVFKVENDGSVVIELVFSGHNAEHLRDLMRTDPIEKLLVSSMMVE